MKSLLLLAFLAVSFAKGPWKRAPILAEHQYERRQANQSCWEACAPGERVTGQHTVFIGVWINDIAALNVEESHLRFDAYVWIRWQRCSVDPTGQLIRPDLGLTVENAIQRVDLTFEKIFPEPDCSAYPGYVYQIWRMEGQLYQKLSFKKYPLDRHEVYMEFEDSVYGREYLIYKKDPLSGQYPASGYSESAFLSGWKIVGFFERERNSIYRTNWGAVQPVFAASSYSNYKVGLEIDRGAQVYILKLLPPVIITLLIAGITFLMDVEAIEVRIGTAVSSLLSLVFLQLSFSQNLPAAIDYLTLMDWILDLGYVLVMAVVVECIVIRKIYYRLLLQGEGIKEEIQLHNLARADSAVSEGLPSDDVVSKLASHTQRKLKIKRRIRSLEKLLFVVYIGVGATGVFIISLSVKFSGY